MQGKQNSLVPVAKVIADLPGLGLAIGPSQHSFTIADQVNQLVEASEADPDMGFMARLMALCSLPRTNPGNQKEYKRVNGPYTLYMIAGGGNKLPFGNLPRPPRLHPPSRRWAAVCRKSCVFSSLPIRKVLVLPFAGGVSPPLPVVSLLFSASYPQDRRSYYLFFNYLSYYLYVLPV